MSTIDRWINASIAAWESVFIGTYPIEQTDGLECLSPVVTGGKWNQNCDQDGWPKQTVNV